MRGGRFFSVLITLSLASCGLDTIPSLNPPDVDYLSSKNSERSVSLIHSSSRYDGTDFSGYQIYYKIYPMSSDFTRLLADRSSLSTSPTVSQLINLGYRSLTFSTYNEGTSTGTEVLLVENLNDGDTVTVDFNDFLSVQATPTTQPVLKINETMGPRPYLYRTAAQVGTSQQTFSALKTVALERNPNLPNNGLPVDISGNTTDTELQNRQFEINIFIAAYGITADLLEVQSSPVPWGVIRTIQP